MDSSLKTTALYKKVISDSNIYSAIYSIHSTIYEKSLLPHDDIKRLNAINNRYDVGLIAKITDECRKKINEILLNKDQFFDIQVYFKIKSYDDSGTLKFRPIHTADLVTQISIIALFNVIAFNDTIRHKRELSSLSQLFPTEFYGNMPSTEVEHLFIPWQTKYGEYNRKTLEKAKEYIKNEKYNSEVSVDIQNFFPSVSPGYIFNSIIEKVKLIYNNSGEMNCFEAILSKLLFFNVTNLKKNEIELYYPKGCEYKKGDVHNIGLPQGLPHTYYLANLCMMDISAQMEKIFPGDSYFYVDDSILFTNCSSEDEFRRKVKLLNKKLQLLFEKDQYKFIPVNTKLKQFHKSIPYQIKVHDAGKKSYILNLQHEELKINPDKLLILAQPASTVAFEIRASLSDITDETLYKKIKILLEAVEKEIELINSIQDNDENKNNSQWYELYLKRLNSYYKFYAYRFRFLEQRREDITEEEALELLKDNFSISNDKQEIIELIDKDIFQSRYRLLNKYYLHNDDALNKIRNHVISLEHRLCDSISPQCLYYHKDISHYSEVLKNIGNDYDGIQHLLEKMPSYQSSSFDRIITALNLFIECAKDGTMEKWQCMNIHLPKSFEFVYYSSDSFRRKLYNGIVSKILDTPINDEYRFFNNKLHPIPSYALRLLAWLRNNKFKTNDFLHFSTSLIDDVGRGQYKEKIDYELMDILPLYCVHVQMPKDVDTLIRVHEYVNGIWKNGSKFLHFFTLHNTEHSIEVARKALDIIRSLSYIKAQRIDYYILFIACYFHDISMAIYPNLHDILSEMRFRKRDMKHKPHESLSVYLLRCYTLIDSFIETQIRKKHHSDSANYMTHSSDLDFIDDLVLHSAADAAMTHGEDNYQLIYDSPSKFENTKINTRNIKIALRLADTLDMSKDRVSPYKLGHDSEFMPNISKFHWMSHMAISSCHIETEYKLTKKRTKLKTYLGEGCIKEYVKIVINLNLDHKSSFNSNTCNYCSATLNPKGDIVIIPSTKSKNCSLRDSSGCSLVCKWMAIKNEYLYKEISYISDYLKNNKDHWYDTRISVEIRYSTDKAFPAKYLNFVKSHILNTIE